MKRAALYLHGQYPNRYKEFYRSLANSRSVIAVDGGYSFVRRAGLEPTIIIGDFDSLKKPPRNLPGSVKVITHPVHKDQTDVELAVRLCLESGVSDLILVCPSSTEMDHFLGAVGLLEVISRSHRPLRARLISHAFLFELVRDGSVSVIGRKGEVLSVFPLSRQIELSTQGTRYRAERIRVARGESLALRNLLTANRAKVTVKGTALVYHTHPGEKLR